MPCRIGKTLKKLVAEELPGNVVRLHADPALEQRRRELSEAAIAFCIARCGGCELTRQRETG